MTTATKTRRGVQTDAYSHVLQFLTAIDNEGSALLAEDDHGKVFILDKETL